MSDYNFLMESRLSPAQFRVLNHISRIAAEQGLNLYLAGGAVRDLTFGQRTVRDLDFVVGGNPQKVLPHLVTATKRRAKAGQRRINLSEPAPLEIEHLRFDRALQSAEFTFTNGVRGELALARNEVYSKPGRRPAITPAAIFEDLKRRDFSVDSMAVSLHPNSRGLLLDPTNGGADVENHELRVLHSRSFVEDPSRIYRLLRLGLRLGFKPSERTKQYLDSALENRAWERMDPEQEGRELRAILQEENVGQVLKMFAQRGLLAGLDRKLARTRVPYDRLTRIRSVLRIAPDADPILLNFHCLAEKFSAGYRKRLAGKVILHKGEIDLVFTFDREARKLARLLASSKGALSSQVYTLLLGQPQSLLLFILAHYPRPKVQNRVKNFLLKFPQILARLPRAELQALGVKPGPEFEKIIHRIFFDQLDGKIKAHPQLLKAMRAYAGIKEPPPKPVKHVKPAKSAKPTVTPKAPKTPLPAPWAKTKKQKTKK